MTRARLVAVVAAVAVAMCLQTAGAQTTGCDRARTDVRQSVCAYLTALRDLDHAAMNRLWSPDAVSIDARGTAHAIDRRRMSDFRAFEREMKTRWTSRIRDERGDTIIVLETEASDYYDLLGVGPRTQIATYVVHGRLIASMASRDSSAVPYAPVAAAFARWLLTTDAATDRRLVVAGDVVFDGASARAMRPWLERWRHEQRR